MGLIYMLTSPSGKKYVGQTKQRLARRWYQHWSEAYKGSQGCRAVYSAIRKYGKDSFKVCVLESNVADEDLDWTEDFYIVQQNTLAPNGYNLRIWTMGPAGFSDETKAIISKIKKEQWADPECRKNLANCHSDASIQKVVDLWKGRRELKAQGMTSEEAQKMEVKYQKSQKKRFRDLEMRRAMRDPVQAAAWHEANARMTPDDRKRQEMFKQRMERVARMSYLDGQEYLLKLKSSAMSTAKKTGASLEHIERWYPNVLTGKEITALRKNGGVWPGSVPAPRASSASTKRKRVSNGGGTSKDVQGADRDPVHLEALGVLADLRPVANEEVSEDEWDLGPAPSSSIVSPPRRAGDLRSEGESESEDWYLEDD